MFGTIRKHQSWLWVLIIGVTIIGMVSFFSPTSQFSGRPGGGGYYGAIDGKRVTQHEFENAYREAHVGFFLNYGFNNKPNFDKNTETYQRLFLIQKLEEYNIDVDPESVAQEAREILRQQSMMMQQEVTLDKLLRGISQHIAVQDTDFERYVRHNLAAQQLIMLVGLGGDLVTPQDARMIYAERHQEVVTSAVFFFASNHLAEVTVVPPAALLQFYSNQPAYIEPRRVQVSYVRFPITNFFAEAERQLAEVTNLNYAIEQDYLKRGSNYFRDAKSPEEAKAKIREQIRHEIAMVSARKKANTFLGDVFNINPMKAENLATLARTNGLTTGLTKPFDQDNGPTEFDGGPNFGRAAFALSLEEPISEHVLVGDDSIFVIALEKKIPSALPPLEQIRERVVADYKFNQAVNLARMAGLRFAQSFTNGQLPAGKNFSAVCADAKLKPVGVPPFSLSSTNALPQVEEHASLRQYQSASFVTSPGKVSEFVSSSEGGFVVFVEKRLPVDEAQVNAALPEFLARVRQGRRQELFNAWFQRESSRALREILRPNQPASGPGQPGQDRS